MAKSDGTQFLLNIKPKYRNNVSVILEQKKNNREASDWVCQAILEKFAREENSLERQVEQMLQSEQTLVREVKPKAVHTTSVERSSIVSQNETQQKVALNQMSATVEKNQESELPPTLSSETNSDEENNASMSNKEQIEEDRVTATIPNEPTVNSETTPIQPVVVKVNNKEIEPNDNATSDNPTKKVNSKKGLLGKMINN